MERRATEVPPELRAEGDKRFIDGLASVAYDGTERTEFVLRAANEERGVRKVVERIMPGAFDEVLRDADIRVLRNHAADNLLGRTKSGTATVSADTRGLSYSTTVGETQVARDTVDMLQRGDLSGSSFAFTIADEEIREEGETIAVEIKRVEQLYDVGPVTYPAYQATNAGVRSGDPHSVLSRVEKWEAEQADEDKEGLQNRYATYSARAKIAGGLADAPNS